MTTPTPNVGNSNSEGAGDNQTPVSQNQGQPIAGAPQGSQEFLELKKRLELTEKELRGLQSRQDKEKNETQRFLDELKAHMAKGLTLDEASQAVSESRKAQEKDDLLYRIAEKVGVLNSPPQPPSAGNGGNVANAAAKAVIDELKLDANTPEVVSILAKGLDPAMQELELRRFAMRPRPTPSAAESATISSSPAPTGADVDKLNAELAILSKEPSKNYKRIQEIGAILKKA